MIDQPSVGARSGALNVRRLLEILLCKRAEFAGEVDDEFPVGCTADLPENAPGSSNAAFVHFARSTNPKPGF